MNNLTYFPFERINYYHGKLLTEQDFVKEQQYMNDKRRLHNRFFHGTGVVAGLRVLMVNESSLSIEDGVGIDFSGREIVVDVPVVHKLSAIDGFQKIAEEHQVDEIYLCVEYQEKVMDISHSAMEKQADKYKEGYHFYLTEKEPSSVDFGAEDLMIARKTLFENSNLKIEQLYYKAVVSGESFKTSVKVLNKGNVSKVNVQIREVLEGAFYDKQTECQFSFENLILERGESAEQIMTLRAKRLDYGAVTITIPATNMSIELNEKNLIEKTDISLEIPITKDSLLDILKKEYFENTMGNIVTNNYPRGIYLAKILLIKQGTSYVMEQVHAMPFRQYVYSTSLMVGMMKELERSLRDMKEQIKDQPQQTKIAIPSAVDENTESGFLEIPFTFPSKAGQIYYSHEVYHNLGMGVFDVALSEQEQDCFYTGDGEIFPDKKIKAKLAVKQNVRTASFVVGVKLLQNTNENSMMLRYVVKKEPEKIESGKAHLTLMPSKLELKRRELYCIEAICEGIPGATILWSVNDTNGGSIGADGTYTAPNHEGVFEVVAVCEQRPEIKASLFIIVRE